MSIGRPKQTRKSPRNVDGSNGHARSPCRKTAEGQFDRKFVNCRSTPMSLPFSSAMISCRVSRSLLTTRTVSPWMLACAFFFESLIAATMIFAFSDGIPWTSLIFCRTLEFAAGSIFSNSRFFS